MLRNRGEAREERPLSPRLASFELDIKAVAVMQVSDSRDFLVHLVVQRYTPFRRLFLQVFTLPENARFDAEYRLS